MNFQNKSSDKENEKSSYCRLDIDGDHNCNMSSNPNHFYRYSGIRLKPSKFTFIEIPMNCVGFELDETMDVHGVMGKFEFVGMILASTGILDKNIRYTSVVIGNEVSAFTDLHEWFHILHDVETTSSNKFNNLFEPISDINEPEKNFEFIKNMCRNPKSHINSGRRPIILCYYYNCDL
jgi:hypothetical protein